MPPSSIVQSSTLQLRQSIAGGRSRVSKDGRDPIELVGELIFVELIPKWIERRSCCAFYTHSGRLLIAWRSRNQITFPAGICDRVHVGDHHRGRDHMFA